MKLILPLLLLASTLTLAQSKRFIRNIESIRLNYDAAGLHNNGQVSFSINVNTLEADVLNSVTSHKVKLQQFYIKCSGPIQNIKETHKAFTVTFDSNIDPNEKLLVEIHLKKDTTIKYVLEVPVIDYKNEIETIELAYNSHQAYAGNTVNFSVINYLKSGDIIRTGPKEKRIMASDFEFSADGPANIVKSSFFKSQTGLYLFYNSFMRNHPKISAKLKRNDQIKVEREVPINYGVTYVIEGNGKAGSRGGYGNNGRCGGQGGKYTSCDLNGKDGYDGESGDEGREGYDGYDAPNVIVRLTMVTNTRGEQSIQAEITSGQNQTYTRYVSLTSGQISIYARGGSGGRGGEGGDGGSGGKGGKGYKPCSDEDKKKGTGGRGGNGGRAGDGGNGGRGGDGGDVMIQYSSELSEYLDKIVVYNNGGPGGRGGSAGDRGCKGKGGSGVYCGSDGRRGMCGSSGRIGYAGHSGEVNFIQLD